MRIYKAIQHTFVLLVISTLLFLASLSISLYNILNDSKYKRVIKERLQKIDDLDERIEYLESLKILTEKAIKRNLKSKNLDATCKNTIMEQL
jgi:cell division protein FtsL